MPFVTTALARARELGRTPLAAPFALAAIGAVVFVGFGALRGPVPAPAAAIVSAPAALGDTIVVYGPRRFETPTGSPANHIERFAVAVQPGQRYTLRVDNGNPDGTGRVTGGSVILNGSAILSSSTLVGGGPGWRRVVQVLVEDTLQVTVQGAAGAALTVALEATADASFLVFGPERFIRTTGTPSTDVRQFAMTATAAAPYRLCLVNGNPDGTQRLSSATITLNGVEVLSPSDLNQQVGSLIREVTLQAQNTVEIRLTAKPNGFLDLCFTATDVTPPVLTITAPAPNLVTRDAQVTVTGTVQDETATAVTVNGVVATQTGSGAFSAVVPLATDGSHTITVIATDAAGLVSQDVRTVIRDTQAPILVVTAPMEGLITNQPSLVVLGTVLDQTAVTVNANAVPLPVANGLFTGLVPAAEGLNLVSVTATDAAGNATTVVRSVTLDTQTPILVVAEPADGATTTADAVTVSGTVTDATAVTVTANGQGLPVAPDHSFTGQVPVALGANTITVVATDAATNSTTATRSVTRTPAGPPDPVAVATPIDRSEATLLQASTEFLYAGASPVQTGVAPGTISLVRAAVLRGRVLDRALQPLAGVTVTIAQHSELGETVTRADGQYDLAVNGGGGLTVDFQKGGYFPAQRQVDVPWQDYTLVDDVILLQPDAAVTVVDLTSSATQAVRGSVVTDADGPR